MTLTLFQHVLALAWTLGGMAPDGGRVAADDGGVRGVLRQQSRRLPVRQLLRGHLLSRLRPGPVHAAAQRANPLPVCFAFGTIGEGVEVDDL